MASFKGSKFGRKYTREPNGSMERTKRVDVSLRSEEADCYSKRSIQTCVVFRSISNAACVISGFAGRDFMQAICKF